MLVPFSSVESVNSDRDGVNVLLVLGTTFPWILIVVNQGLFSGGSAGSLVT